MPRAEKRGKQVLYTIQFDHLAETLRGIADAIEACNPIRYGQSDLQPSAPGVE
jgi:hypothetical protein